MSYTTGEAVVVSWTGFPPNAQDWIGISIAGSPSSEYIAWQYTGGTASGMVTFNGLGAGTYVARGYYNNSLVMEHESAPFTIAAGPAATVTTDKATYNTSETAIASFSNATGSATDWIAIAAVGSPNTSYVTYQYTGGGASGMLSFPLAGIPAGNYEARLFANNTFTLLDASDPFMVTTVMSTAEVTTDSTMYVTGADVTVNFTGMSGSSTDWISIATVGSGPTSFVTYQYTGGAASGSLVFSGLPNGNYVARAYFNNSFVVEDESPSFTIAPAP
jgi:hypothetical protein